MNEANCETRAAGEAWKAAAAAASGRQGRRWLSPATQAYLRPVVGPFLVYFSVLASTMLLAMAGVTVAFQEIVQQERMRAASEAFANQLVALIGIVQALPPELRDPYLDRLGSKTQGKLVAEEIDPALLIQPESRVVGQFFEELGKHLPAHTIAVTDSPSPMLWLSVPVERGRNRWVRFTLAPLVDVPAGLMLGVALLVTTGASAAAAFLMLRLRKRLFWLAQAMDTLDPRSDFVPPAGSPTDFEGDDPLDLGRRFAEMSQRLADSRVELSVMMQETSRDIRSHLDRLRQTLPQAPAPPQAYQRIDELERSMEQFAAFAQSQSALEPAALVDINREILDVMARLPGAASSVVLDLGGLPYARCRPSLRRRTLSSLIDNALRHGGQPVEVQTSLEQGWIVVRIADRGPGVSGDELALMGRPFYRTEAARQRGAGSGLSLATARREIEHDGGELRLARRAGGGLQVELWLAPARIPEGEEPLRF